MRKVGWAIALGAGAILLAQSPDANADTYGTMGDSNGSAFALELAQDRLVVSSSDAAFIAHAICLDRADGVSEVAERQDLERTYSIGLSVDAVDGAEFHFCPRFADGLNQALAQNGGRPVVSFSQRGGGHGKK
jgi:hypothetical protein